MVCLRSALERLPESGINLHRDLIDSLPSHSASCNVMKKNGNALSGDVLLSRLFWRSDSAVDSAQGRQTNAHAIKLSLSR
jgi:hypothetical protein